MQLTLKATDSLKAQLLRSIPLTSLHSSSRAVFSENAAHSSIKDRERARVQAELLAFQEWHHAACQAVRARQGKAL